MSKVPGGGATRTAFPRTVTRPRPFNSRCRPLGSLQATVTVPLIAVSSQKVSQANRRDKISRSNSDQLRNGERHEDDRTPGSLGLLLLERRGILDDGVRPKLLGERHVAGL